MYEDGARTKQRDLNPSKHARRKTGEFVKMRKTVEIAKGNNKLNSADAQQF